MWSAQDSGRGYTRQALSVMVYLTGEEVNLNIDASKA